MANLKEIRNRITSVSSTMQITSAMKMVSAAKLKRAQDAVTKMRPYAQKLNQILSSLTSTLDTSENEFAASREVKNVLIVVMSSNRGLCGGFNNYVIKEALKQARETYKDKNVAVITVGKKATDTFRKSNFNIKGSHLPKHLDELWVNLKFSNAAPVAEKIMEAYKDKHIDKVVLIYNRFKNVATQIVTTEQFLPIVPAEKKEGNAQLDYIFEPTKEEIVNELIPKSLKIQFYSALLDSFAGEHGARMTAMHKATDNASALNKKLKLDYNKARQAAITNEILEIVGGAEALKG
ncbi:MAG: ATP synthase F1 subunit gamma [Crocinitomicaceae bacterium]|nr:ATP synthase F1 subunit gamma [Crocinitomicaceae bacterium]